VLFTVFLKQRLTETSAATTLSMRPLLSGTKAFAPANLLKVDTLCTQLMMLLIQGITVV